MDFNKETFNVGKEYLLEDIIEMGKINNEKLTYHNSFDYGKLRKQAIHINFKEDDVDLWFIKTNYSKYKCVLFEN